MDRLFRILAIGFRQVDPDRRGSAVRLNHALQCGQMFEAVFSSDDDETIADAVCIWIVDSVGIPPGSFARYLARRLERTDPLSPRLRRMSIRAIECIGRDELEVSGLETIRLLNRLKADVDSIVDEPRWAEALISAIRSPAGMGTLSSHCWRLLGNLVLVILLPGSFAPRDVEVMKALEEAGDWETLEVWMAVIWRGGPTPKSTEDVERMTLELLSQRPSALLMFENSYKENKVWKPNLKILQRICDKARAERSPSKCPPRL